MCKALGSIPSKREVPLSVRQSSCGASERESRGGRTQPHQSPTPPPIITGDLSRPELKVQEGLSPSRLPHTVRKCRGSCSPRRTGLKEANLGIWWEAATCPLLSSSGQGRFDAFRLWGIRPITEPLEVYPMPFPTPLSPPVFIYSKKTKGNLQSPD